MSISGMVDAGIAVVALLLIGTGLAIKDPAIAMVVVGGILLSLVVIVRLRKGAKQ